MVDRPLRLYWVSSASLCVGGFDPYFNLDWSRVLHPCPYVSTRVPDGPEDVF